MPDFHHVNLRTFAHATEDAAKVRQAIRTLAGDAPVSETRVEGTHGNEILILEATISRSADVKAFWARVKEAGLVPRLLGEVEDRLDEQGVFFVRFAKQDAFLGEVALARDDDAIHVRAKPAAFPASREGARDVLVRALERLSA